MQVKDILNTVAHELPVFFLFGTGLSLPVVPWILAVMLDPLLKIQISLWLRLRLSPVQFRLTGLLSASLKQHMHAQRGCRFASAQLCV